MTIENLDQAAPISVPEFYDYCAIYMSHRCHLACTYCITEHNDTSFLSSSIPKLKPTPQDWIQGLNRLNLPEGVPITLQGGEPFMYKGIPEIIDGVKHEVDILTALPPHVKPETFTSLKHIEKLNRNAPYPNIRVSFHPGQNEIDNLIPRIKELQEIVSIGLYMVEHPDSLPLLEEVQSKCADAGIFFKTKEFLGFHDGKLYGEYRYDDACVGSVTRPKVECRNSVLIVDTTGDIYKCHSDLYHRRQNLTVGNVFDPAFDTVSEQYYDCHFYGLCSECDVKVKTNHHQVFGYTSVDIKFSESESPKDRVPTS